MVRIDDTVGMAERSLLHLLISTVDKMTQLSPITPKAQTELHTQGTFLHFSGA